MIPKTVIIYSSFEGQTRKVCLLIQNILEENNHKVDCFHIRDFNKELINYDKIILASSIRYGKHNELIKNFICKNLNVLNSKKTAFISVNLVARKLEKSTYNTNPYTIKFFNEIAWEPTLIGVFAGKLNYKLYGVLDRFLIKLIMWMTKGPTCSKTAIEYTNWNDVTHFANELTAI